MARPRAARSPARPRARTPCPSPCAGDEGATAAPTGSPARRPQTGCAYALRSCCLSRFVLLGGQRQEEGRTRTDLGFECERAVMLVDDRRASHCESLATTITNNLNREERVEHLISGGGRGAAAGGAGRGGGARGRRRRARREPAA